MHNHVKQLLHLATSIILVSGTAACAAPNNKDKVEQMKKPIPALEQPTAVPIKQPEKKAPKPIKIQIDREQQILVARTDLAKKLGLELQKVSLSGALDVTWRSGAMGCPKVGGRYTNAMVPGLSIMLLAEGQAYRYHAKKYDTPFHCPDHLAEPPYQSASNI